MRKRLAGIPKPKKEYIEWGISTPYYFLKYKF